MMKLKSRLGAFLAVTALLGAALAGFTGCPLEGPSEASGPEGYGQVTIDCGDASASVNRSVFPGKTGLTYEYAFTKTGGSPQTITPANGAFTLEYGEWTVEVKAYAGSDQSSSNLAATGASEPFTVSASPQTVSVELTGVSDTGSGTFKYNIQYPAGVTITSFTMKKLPSLSASVSLSYTPVTSGGTTVISETVNSVSAGFYLVTVTAEKNGGNSGRNEIVHIYNGLTSELTIAFTADDFTAVPLTENVWAAGSLAAGGTQWFSFTATASTQYINVAFGTLTNLYVQLYDSTGAEVGTQANLDSSTRSISQTLTAGSVYYVKVRPYSSSNSGTYRVTFSNTASVTIPSSGVTALTENFWAAGSISTSSGTQWFSFTATSTNQYIHVAFGTLNDLYVQLYDNGGLAVGAETNLYSSTRSISRTLTAGNVYYVKVRPYSSYSGSYWIGFNASSSGIPSLTENVWAAGSLAAGGTQWFSFTATASTQYIHVAFGTLTDLYVQLYNSSGAAVGDETNLYVTTRISRTVTAGNVYYVKVRPFSSSYSGAYQIGFNTSSTAPVIPSSVVPLTENVWADGSLAAGGTQWFSFTATASTQYIHVAFGTLNDLNVQLYNSTGATIGTQVNLYGSARSISRPVTAGSVYYVKVWPYSSSYSGAYQIGFNASSTAPSP